MTASYVLTFGETMGLIAGTQTGSFAHVPQASIGIGGSESNVAIGLARLNVPVKWIGRVGDDSLGTRIIREIRGEGVDVRSDVDTQAATGLMLKEFTRRGTSRVTYYRSGSAGSKIAPTDIGDDLVENASLVHLTGITPFLSDTARQTCLEVVRRAKAAGVKISFDINYRASIAAAGPASQILEELIAEADVVFGSPEEYAILSTDPATATQERLKVEETAAELIGSLQNANDHAQYVVKRGADGASAHHGGASFSDPGHVVEVVDTVGAGDAFVAGYLSGEVQGWTIARKLARANACGALMCTSDGDWEASATPRDLAEFLDSDADPVRR